MEREEEERVVSQSALELSIFDGNSIRTSFEVTKVDSLLLWLVSGRGKFVFDFNFGALFYDLLLYAGVGLGYGGFDGLLPIMRVWKDFMWPPSSLLEVENTLPAPSELGSSKGSGWLTSILRNTQSLLWFLVCLR